MFFADLVFDHFLPLTIALLSFFGISIVIFEDVGSCQEVGRRWDHRYRSGLE